MSSDEEDLRTGEAEEEVEGEKEEEEEEEEENEPAGDDLEDDDEEDEEEEGPDEYEKDDWMVDDVEEGGEEEGGEEAEENSKERARKEKRKRKRKERHASLDEDDLDLIEENTGKRVTDKKKFKRLQRAGGGRGGMEGEEEEEEEEEERPPEDEGEEEGEEDEMADFIVDGVDENGEPIKKPRGGPRKSQGMSGVTSAAVADAMSIFGDPTEFLDKRSRILANRQLAGDEGEAVVYDEDGYEQPRAPTQRQLAARYEPSVLEAKFLTEEDEEIRIRDVPERYQLMERVVGPILGLRDGKQEAEWIFDRVFGHLAAVPRPEYRALGEKREAASDMSQDQRERMLREVEEDREGGVKEVQAVLECMHEKRVEVPFIGMYRRKLCPRLMEEMDERTEPRLMEFEALWAIQAMDVKWMRFQNRKANLQKAFESRRPEEEEVEAEVVEEFNQSLPRVLRALREASNEHAMGDVETKFNLQFPPLGGVGEGGGVKRAVRKSQFAVLKEEGLGQMNDTHEFVLSAYKLGENLKAMYRVSESVDPTVPPEEAALELLGDRYPTPAKVVAGVAELIAIEVSVEPGVRDHVRTAFASCGKVSTRLTGKGKAVIDDFHPYANVRRLVGKPFGRFVDEQWLLVDKAEEEGLLEVTLDVDHASVVEKILIPEFEQAYTTEAVSQTARQWNDVRKKIIRLTIARILAALRREVRATLLGRARAHLQGEISHAFFQKLSVAPFQPPRAKGGEGEEGQWVRIMAAVWGPGNPATTFVMLDDYGEVVDYLHAAYVSMGGGGGEGEEKKRRDLGRLKEFITEHKPHAVVVGAGSQQHSRRLKNTIYEVIFSITEEDPRALTSVVDSVDVYPEDDSWAALYAGAKIADVHLPGSSGLIRKCAALGRMLQNRVAVAAALCGPQKEILSLTMHPLQHLLSDDDRWQALEQTLVSVTNQVGVDVNAGVQHDWMMAPLQFVGGLGPRKAEWVGRKVKGLGLVETRRALVEEEVVGVCVFLNAGGAIRVRAQENVLDDTRIHPQQYKLAEKMAQDAFVEFEGRSGGGGGDKEDAVEKVRDDPVIIRSLDVGQYRTRLRERGGVDEEEQTLLFIKRELMRGYEEWGVPYNKLGSEEEFYLLSGESPETVAVGKVVHVTVRKVMGGKVLCSLESGVTGVIDRQDVSDDVDAELSGKMREGDVVMCRIKEVVAQSWQVNLTCKGSDLRSDMWRKMRKWDDWLRLDLVAKEEEEEEEAKAKAKPKPRSGEAFLPRMVNFEQFDNVSREEAVQRLSDKEVGEYILRPSSKGVCHLSLTLKFHPAIYTHIDIVEEGKDPKDPTAQLQLGRPLRIGAERFEDLDEVIARYVDPVISHLRTLIEYRKYLDGSKAEVDHVLMDEKRENANRIPYYLSLSHEHSGAIRLSFIRSANPIHEYISVSPKGFRFRQNEFTTPDRLVRFFQQHISDPIETPRRAVAAIVAPPPKSPGQGVQGGGYGQPLGLPYRNGGGGGWGAVHSGWGAVTDGGVGVGNSGMGGGGWGTPQGTPGLEKGWGVPAVTPVRDTGGGWGNEIATPGQVSDGGGGGGGGGGGWGTGGQGQSGGGGGGGWGDGSWGASNAKVTPGREVAAGGWGAGYANPNPGRGVAAGGWGAANSNATPGRDVAAGGWGSAPSVTPGREVAAGGWGAGGGESVPGTGGWGDG